MRKSVIILFFFMCVLIPSGCSFHEEAELNVSLNEIHNNNNEATEDSTISGGIIEDGGPNMLHGLFNADNQQADQLVEQLISAIENQDREAIDRLFAGSIVDNVNDWNQQVSALFDFYEGELVSLNRQGLSASQSLNGSARTKEVIISYDIETTSREYRIAIKYCTINSVESSDTGMHSLYLIEAPNSDLQFAYWGGHEWNRGIVIEYDNLQELN